MTIDTHVMTTTGTIGPFTLHARYDSDPNVLTPCVVTLTNADATHVVSAVCTVAEVLELGEALVRLARTAAQSRGPA